MSLVHPFRRPLEQPLELARRHGPLAVDVTFGGRLASALMAVLAGAILLPLCAAMSIIAALLAQPEAGDGRWDLPPAARPPPPRHPSLGCRAMKRAVDILVAGMGLVLLLPVIAAVAVAIKLDGPGPVLFRQHRVGRDGKVFAIRKFRTMVVGAPSLGGSLTVGSDPRVTRVGAVLRRRKLDELPQLLDVLVGNMSLVGPRPEVPDLMTHYGVEKAAVICAVRPGLTDDASILFRDEGALLAEALDPDAYYRDVIMPIKYGYYERYLDEIGLATDIRVIAATAILLVTGRIPDALDRRRVAIPAGFGTLPPVAGAA